MILKLSINFTLPFILLCSLFLTACGGQEQNKLVKSKIGSPTNSQVITETPTDPLFFLEGQLCQHLRKIYQGQNGHLWFGTNVYDLMRYDGDTLEYFTEKDGFGGGRVTSILEDQEGNVWFGTYGGMTKYNPHQAKGQKVKFVNYLERDGAYKNDIWSVLIDRKGVFWVGTTDGVRQFDGQTFTPFPIPKTQVKDTTTIYGYDRIIAILEDQKGTLWFGTDGFGICKYDGQEFTLLTMEDGLPGNIIRDLMQDSKGNIWIGTALGGISRYDGRSFTNFTQQGIIEGVEVGGLYEDRKGRIWFAAENHGVYCYDPSLPESAERFTNFNKKDGLNTNGILSIFEDREGRFWFGGWGGLFRYDSSQPKGSGKSFFSVTKDGPWGI